MCGISGIISKSFEKVTLHEIKKITDVISHRGPNSEGFLIKKNFAFGHRRLSIIDLNEISNQPFWYEDKFAIVYNGEVYNYLEIKSELEDLGYTFKTKSDTEVILASYQHWGEKCVEKFNGMWSFCIFDSLKDILFFSRDRFGVKPLYYSSSNTHFVFGSEIKQLLGYTKRIVDKRMLLDYIILNVESQVDCTFFKEVKSLPPGHNLIFNLTNNYFEIVKYYEIQYNDSFNKLDYVSARALVKDVLYDSIKLRLRSDVQVGSCISGGLDSSFISSIASELNNGSNYIFKGIHAKSTDKMTDESDFANQVARFCGFEIKVTEPDNHYFKENIERLTYVQEEPIPGASLLMQYSVFEKAKKEGCIVMLDGQGGDETLLGYERYLPAVINNYSIIRKIYNVFSYSKKTHLSFFSLILYFFYFKYPRVRKIRLLQKASFVKRALLKKMDFSVLKALSDSYKSVFELQKLEINRTQLMRLLRYEDKNSMAHSIEARLPFLDYRFVEIAASINPEFKIHNGWSKFILRDISSEKLPYDISWRRDKKGFESPTTWINDIESFLPVIKKSKLLSEIVNPTNPKLNKEMIWKLYSIAVWEKVFDVQIDKHH
jgi:asparagine synthase (glutamine-hydrolysing)